MIFVQSERPVVRSLRGIDGLSHSLVPQPIQSKFDVCRIAAEPYWAENSSILCEKCLAKGK